MLQNMRMERGGSSPDGHIGRARDGHGGGPVASGGPGTMAGRWSYELRSAAETAGQSYSSERWRVGETVCWWSSSDRRWPRNEAP
jgi:hypothetical protein